MAQQKTMTTCPECGAKVRKDNLKGHIAKVHRKVEEAPVERATKTARGRVKTRRIRVPWRLVAIVVVLSLVSVGVYAILMRSGNPVAVISTNYGVIKIQLYADKAPTTTGNFIALADRGFFDRLTFHRVVKDFVIQGGDPNGDGTGGSGQTIPWENTGLKNVKYSVAMARSGDPNSVSGANTATSQFFVNLKDNPDLDNYAYPFVVFGQVIEGQSVVDAIGQVEVDSNSRPLSPVTMYSVTIVR
jgi:peptidyl-prolyl cis-trans isomerase B (cyclophilin B)